MPPVRRYRWDTPEYADAFAALLRAGGARTDVYQVLRDLTARYPETSRAVDWGAGGGDLTRVLLERLQTVYAVEPAADMRAVLAARCPRARVMDGTIASAVLPEPVEVGVISHVFYHVPDHKWGAYTIRAADRLSPDGVLLVILNAPDAGPYRMLEHFGAPRFDLYAGLDGVLRRYPEFDFAFTRRPGTYRTTSFEDTLTISRFVLCDRDEDAFARPPSEEEFRDYVRANFWDEERQEGGWACDVVFCHVRRNLSYQASR